MKDWKSPHARISRHFTVHEALFLPSWGIYHEPFELEQAAILRTAQWLDRVRDFVGRPIKVHCWLRPGKVNCPGTTWHGRDYNAAIGGAPKSAHRLGRAVDWSCGEDCATTRTKLKPKLEEWGLRMEDVTGQWVHLDDMPVGPSGKRFFKP